MDFRKFLNYVGQLRIYSFVDMLVFATALTSDIRTIIGIGFLWLGFLLYLESQHHDPLRSATNGYLWIIPFVLSLALLPTWLCFIFAFFSYFYAKKKSGLAWGISAPLWRGLQNGILAWVYHPQIAFLAFTLSLVRNLVGDFRDVSVDRESNAHTLPVLLGIKENQSWAFYGHMLLVVASTLVWFHSSFLDMRLALPVILIQIISYPLTPRMSNPKHLNIWK